MNRKPRISGYFVLLLLLAPAASWAQGARVQLEGLARLSDKAEETVDVSVDTKMLKQTAGFLSGKGADAERMNNVIDKITGIYVKSFKFTQRDAYSDADVESIRRQVSGSAWNRIVSVREKHEVTEIYFFRNKDVPGGLLVLSAEPNELTVVNIVGEIDLAALAALSPIIPKLPGLVGKGMRK